MPARRSSIRRGDHRITPEAVEAYRAGEWMNLHRALGLKPWEPSPLHAVGECGWSNGSAGAASWPKVRALRAELEAATTAG